MEAPDTTTLVATPPAKRIETARPPESAGTHGNGDPPPANGSAKPAPKPDPQTQPDLASWSVPLASIDAEGSPFRFRRQLRPDVAIKALAASIDAEGLLHPLVVRKVASTFQLVAGFRRHAALGYLARTKGVDPAAITVKVSVLRDGTTDDEALAVSFAENLARKTLGADDKAIAAVKLRDSFGKTQEEIGAMLKLSRRQLGNLMGLMSAPDDVRGAFREGRFGLKQALALAKVADRDARALLIQRSAVKRLRTDAVAAAQGARRADEPAVAPKEELPAAIRGFVRVSPNADPTRPIRVTVTLASEDAKAKLLKYLVRFAA